MLAIVCALAAALAGVAALWDGVTLLDRSTIAKAIVRLGQLVIRPGQFGHQPAGADRRRLICIACGVLFTAGWLLFNPLVGTLIALGGPVATLLVLRWQAQRYQLQVARGIPLLARGLADLFGAGHSVQGALGQVHQNLSGPVAGELELCAQQLALGATTEAALGALRQRARGSLDAVITALLLQRRTGGDLCRLLRDVAESAEEIQRLAADARSATAQARLSAGIVCGLPAIGLGLLELGSPGSLGRMASNSLSLFLMAVAVCLQLVAAFMIRRITRSAE